MNVIRASSMKFKIKLSIALVMSLLLVACGGGGATPPKKVFKLVKEEIILGGGTSSLSPKVIINTYDDNGLLIRKDHDIDGNGVLDGGDRYYLYTYNDKEQLLIGDWHASSGMIRFRSVYDEHENPVSSWSSSNNDGVLDQSVNFINTYNDAGLLLKTEDQKRIISYTYDGDAVIKSINFLDRDGDPNIIFSKSYNEHGDLIKSQRDSDGDGVYDSSGIIYAYTYTFDNSNNIIKKEEDRNNDGFVNRITVYTWEEFK